MSAAPGTARGGDLASPRADATLMVEGGAGEMRAITRADTYEIKAPPPPDPVVVTEVEPEEEEDAPAEE